MRLTRTALDYIQAKASVRNSQMVRGVCRCSTIENAATGYDSALPVGFEGPFCDVPLPKTTHSCSDGDCRAPYDPIEGLRKGTYQNTENEEATSLYTLLQRKT